MHFINEFISDPTINFFNCNFDITFTCRFGNYEVKSSELLPVTAFNYSMDSKNKKLSDIDIITPIVVTEAILLFVDSSEAGLDTLVPHVDSNDYAIFGDLCNDLASYMIIDDESLLTSNINVVTIKEFRVMCLMKRYFGDHMPILINSVMLTESFYSHRDPIATCELYTTMVG